MDMASRECHVGPVAEALAWTEAVERAVLARCHDWRRHHLRPPPRRCGFIFALLLVG
jgi:hypothetical protein